MLLLVKQKEFWLLCIVLNIVVFYLNLIWKTTGDLDRLTTDTLFCAALLGLLWQQRKQVRLNSSFIASASGLLLIVLVLLKSILLIEFEFPLLSLVPFGCGVGLALVAAGFRGLNLYWQQLCLTWFLFFPDGVISNLIDHLVRITVINAKFAAYLLYYVGFNVITQGNEVWLHLDSLGTFQAIIDYPCAGVPMMLLMLKLALLLIAFIPFKKYLLFLIPIASLGIGFILGVIRVCILILVLQDSAKFEYWHGSEGAQIFSTVAILMFSGLAYWLIQQQELRSYSAKTEKKGSRGVIGAEKLETFQ